MKTIPMPEIIARLMEINHCEANFAENFITEFSAMVERALSESGSLHINGLGSFQRIESGSVVTAEFAPDTALSEAINAPFSIFEPIELDDDVTSDMLDKAADSNIIQSNQQLQDEHPVQTQTDDNEDEALDDNINSTSQNTETISESVPEKQEQTEPDDIECTIENSSDSLELEEESVETPTESETEQSDATENPLSPSSLPENIPPIPCEDNSDTKTHETADSNSETTADEQNETINSNINQHIYRTYSSSHHSHNNYDHHNEHSRRYRRVINAVIIFIVGVISGYFIHSLIFSNVRTVEISANDVQVYQRSKVNNEPLVISKIDKDSIAYTDNSVKDTANKTETEPKQHQNVVTTSATSQKIVTDTIRGNRFLTTMALEHYGMKKFWVYIYLENKEIIKNPDNIAKNTVVVIPPASKYGIKPGDIKSEADAEQLALEIMQRYPKNN